MKQQNVSLINEFKENLKCFKDRTSYITFFDLKDCELFHISSNPNEDFIRIVGTEEMIEKSDEKTISKKFSGILKSNIDESILSLIEDSKITTLVNYKGKILYLDKMARSMLAQKCKCAGACMYDGSYLADVILQANMNKYEPTGKSIKKYPIAVVRKVGKSMLLEAILSKFPEDIETACDYEMSNQSLSLKSYEINDYNAVAVFDGPKINGYTTSIIVEFSDVGRGNKKTIAIRPTGSNTPIPLYEIVDEKDYVFDNLLDKVKEAISSKSKNIVVNPLTVLSTVKGFDAIGKARIKKYFIPGNLKLPEDEFYKKVLSIPDAIGRINKVTDDAFLTSLGNSFKVGAF